MKKILLLSAILLLGLASCSSDEPTISVTNIMLYPTTLQLTVGETKTITATITPNDATNQNVTWASSTPTIATVDAKGAVTAISAGTTTIIVATADGGKTAISNVTVSVPATGITLDRTSVKLGTGRTTRLIATILPENATNRNVLWTSSNPSIATVNDDGVVSGLAVGTATITATTADGAHTATCDITVDGVLINGVPWATRNVDIPGTFAQNPEDAGMFFQWNRPYGWRATIHYTDHVHNIWDDLLYPSQRWNPFIGDWETDIWWDWTTPTGTAWYEENDPCPPGWRVPNVEELFSLRNTAHEWITKNGVEGRRFGIAPNQIFLPAAGIRFSDGLLEFDGLGGFYLSGCKPNYWSVSSLQFNSSPNRYQALADMLAGGLITFGFSIRCVAK